MVVGGTAKVLVISEMQSHFTATVITITRMATTGRMVVRHMAKVTVISETLSHFIATVITRMAAPWGMVVEMEEGVMVGLEASCGRERASGLVSVMVEEMGGTINRTSWIQINKNNMWAMEIIQTMAMMYLEGRCMKVLK